MLTNLPPSAGSVYLKRLLRLWAVVVVAVPALGAAQSPRHLSRIQRIEIQPTQVALYGIDARQQIIVTGFFSNGTQRDLTRDTRFAIKPLSIAAFASGGVIIAKRLGAFTLAARFGGFTAIANGNVWRDTGGKGISFVKDIVPILTMRGCNGGNCHGSMHGKNGFKLSQFGYEPQQDYLMMTRNAGGRRVNLLEPAHSLILLKPTDTISHGGGTRFEVGSQDYNTLADWIAQGAPGPRHSPSVKIARLEVLPSRALLAHPGLKQQLVVVAHYEDGATADVTTKVKYVPQGDGVLTVSEGGLVETMSAGEATVLVRGTGALGVARLEVLSGPPLDDFPHIVPNNVIDTLVFAKLKRLNVRPSELCADEVFLRRAYLDAIGTLPSAQEVRDFLADHDPAKRRKLIDRILNRPEYADYWGMIWADLFTVTAFKTPGQNTFYVDNWLRSQIRQNVRMNLMVRELIAADGPLKDDPGLQLLLAMTPEAAAAYYSQLFLGIRIQCAHCHNHPFEKWTRNDFYGMAAFFPQVATRPSRLGILVYDDPHKELQNPLTHAPAQPTFLGGAVWQPDSNRTRREAIANWITSPNNPYFARALANRVWRHYMGVGLVEPVDDFRETNPATNPELLDALAEEFARGGYDLKHLMKLIMNSRAYQLSSITNAANQADRKDYSHYYLRRIYAEPLLDAISQVTDEPHVFKFGYLGMKAVEVRDPVIPDFFLQTFERNSRQMTCEREENLTLVQSMDFISGSTINDSISRPGGIITQLTAAGISNEKIVEELFLRSLSRFPSQEETRVSLGAVDISASRIKGLQDVLWALLNSKEFIYNH